MTECRQHWESIYASREAQQLSWFQREPQLSLEFISRIGLDFDDPVIDVGGGASVLAQRLLDLGYRDVSVLDISSKSLRKSQLQTGKEARNIKWFSQDVCRFRPTRQYALWHDRALFHFMISKQQRTAYVAALNRALKAGGQAIIASFAMGGPEKCSGLEIVQYEAKRLLHELGSGFSLIEEQQESHKTPGGKAQLFAYYRLLKQS